MSKPYCNISLDFQSIPPSFFSTSSNINVTSCNLNVHISGVVHFSFNTSIFVFHASSRNLNVTPIGTNATISNQNAISSRMNHNTSLSNPTYQESNANSSKI